MKELELTPRLMAIADQVPQGAKLADVGTDHAYLPVYLLLRDRICSAVASDVNEGPLQRGRETARTYEVDESKIAFRICDGLAGVESHEADTVAICGMGGELIARILGAAPWTHEALLLLQPMSSQPELRQWLIANGYTIQRELVVKEGEKYYVILTVTSGISQPYTPAELFVGRQQAGEVNPHRGAYLADQLRRRERALQGMKQGNPAPEVLAQEEALLAGLKDMEKEWNAWQR
ncbi:MAG: SAM-dependent methyltransferase [Ruminiclostridium sp.]|nr:SAM-dependent methyltransferase [Ruminiclostridium sp.]